MKNENNRPLYDVHVRKVEELFIHPELRHIRVLGVVADPNEGKSNVVKHLISIFQERAKETRIVTYALPWMPGVHSIHRVDDLERVQNSFVIIDEFADMIDMNNARQRKRLFDTIRVINHPRANNIVILMGMARDFNGKLAGMIQAYIIKSLTIADAVQRSTLHNFVNTYSGGFRVRKGANVIDMPKDIALIHVVGGNTDEVEVPYVKEYDTKLQNKPVVKWDNPADNLEDRLNSITN